IGNNSSVNAMQDISLTANAQEQIIAVTAGAGGGTVGVAGTIAVTVASVHTYACTGTPTSPAYKCVGASSAPNLNAGGNILVSAVDYFKSLTIAGGAAFGFVGVAGGVDIGVADTNAQAYIGEGANVHARQDVEVNGLSRKEVMTFALSAAGGFVGVAIAVSVW